MIFKCNFWDSSYAQTFVSIGMLSLKESHHYRSARVWYLTLIDSYYRISQNCSQTKEEHNKELEKRNISITPSNPHFGPSFMTLIHVGYTALCLLWKLEEINFVRVLRTIKFFRRKKKIIYYNNCEESFCYL